MVSSRMVTSHRRAGRVTNKTKLLVVRGSEKVDLAAAETIVWEDPASAGGDATKHQHVGAKGVESGEMHEHHLQAALSSASLLHSRPANAPGSPSAPSSKPQAGTSSSSAAGPGPSTHATLNYHIPTPDATGLVQNELYAKLYQAHRYHEPNGYIRFSDTVEESSAGLGGLGYCMDDTDIEWLAAFNNKGEGSSGEKPGSPLKEKVEPNGSMPPPSSVGRPSRGKGKEKEKDGGQPPAPVFISDDTFEYVMGVYEKHTEDSVPMLHTNLSLLPAFSAFEPHFTGVQASFLPNFEIPKGLPQPKNLTRMARNIYSHWRDRRTARKGKSIMPILNYDETNDGDPYVCFRRRDIRATRKTRRTDNLSVERMQKIQFEMRSAHALAQATLQRETLKLASFKVDKEVWEAKWKLYETKKRWPSLGMTKEEEELITGRQSRENAMAAQTQTINANMLDGRAPLMLQRDNIPGIRKRGLEREKEDANRRDSRVNDPLRYVEKSITGRSFAPEALKERMATLRQKLEEEIARRRALDADWDDATDQSYQPLPPSHGNLLFRPITSLDPRYAHILSRQPDSDEDDLPVQASSFRIRRGRGGILRLDRRPPAYASRRGLAPRDTQSLPDWLFPEPTCSRALSYAKRPKSIEQEEDEEDEDSDQAIAKRRKLNEIWRYDADAGGALGVGMGMGRDDDRVIIDDHDPKYTRHRITLLREEDMEKLRPDMTPLALALQTLEAPIELPPTPHFNRPAVPVPNPQMVAAAQLQQQQQMMQQQQQMEQFQRYQILAQQQALAAQQQQAAMAAQAAQARSDGNGQAAGSPAVPPQPMPGPNGRPPMKRPPSSQNGTGNGQAQMGPMGPPQQTRPSLSPTNQLHPQNGQSPQMVNGMVQPANGGKPFIPDQAVQQRVLAARAMAAQQQIAQAQANGEVPDGVGPPQITAEHLELARLAQANGFGNNIQAFLDARNKARLMAMAKQAQQGQAQANGQAPPANGGGQQQQQHQGQFQSSPSLPSGQLQLKFPAHAAAKLGASNGPPQPAPQRAQ